MQHETVIKNGTIVTAENTFSADVGIDKGKVTAIGKGLDGANVLDVSGKYVLPGAIDVHTHWQLPFCGTISVDDFENGSKAGAIGGVTTFIDFAIQTKGKTLAETIAARRAEADPKVCIDYSLHAGITDWNESTRGEIKSVIEGGIPTFKMFMVYKSQGWQADDGILYSALKEASKYGGRIGVHAENNDIIERLTAEHLKKGLTQCKYHSATRTNFTEIEAISRAIRIAEEVGGSLYIFHMSTAGAAIEVKKGRERGVDVESETCPQYLLLTNKLFESENGHWYATCPPIRSQQDCDGMWKSLKEGYVGIVATDSCTFNTKQKAMWEGNFTRIPFGMPGIETMLPLLYTYGVEKKRFGLNKLASLVSEKPARVFGLYPNKGTIAVGSDADIIIIDPKKEKKVSPKNLVTNCDWSPFDGHTLKGFPDTTLLRGEVIVDKGTFAGKKGQGAFVKRRPM